MSKKMICISVPTYVLSVFFIFCSCTTPYFSEFPLFLEGNKEKFGIRSNGIRCKSSAKVHQYDCYYAPFEFDKVPYAWWNDRDGRTKYFWVGNNKNGIHTCQCGINGDCFDHSLKCNCDTATPIQLVDEGYITDKKVLPVTALNFGQTHFSHLETSTGIHTLGRFKCSGSMPFNDLPTSCKDLLFSGHTLKGFYSVMGFEMMETVYCNFVKLPEDEGFEIWIGYTDVKSASVHFNVPRNASFSAVGTPIPFDFARVNMGNAMILTSGDQVWLKISDMASAVSLFDDDHHHTYFTGFMLEEKTFASL